MPERSPFVLTQKQNAFPALEVSDQEMEWIVDAVGAVAALPPSNFPEDIARNKEWKSLSERLNVFFSQTHGPRQPIMNEMYRRKHNGLDPVRGDKYEVPSLGVFEYDGAGWELAQKG